MKRMIFVILATAITGLWPQEVPCAFCWTGPCLNSTICGPNCICLKPGMEPMGKCYGTD